MSEWRLFGHQVPEPPAGLVSRAWMNLEGQPGFAQRVQLVMDLVRHAGPVSSISDLGCGDGALLARLRDALAPAVVPMWGYDLGAADVSRGQRQGLDVRIGDIVRAADRLAYGELVIASEVAEHLESPEGFLRGIPGRLLIISSPSAETDRWHNQIHAWAWDLAGYADLVQRAGWTVTRHAECAGGLNTFAGITGEQKFQAILAVR